MEKLLRSCYDEAGILGANALIYCIEKQRMFHGNEPVAVDSYECG